MALESASLSAGSRRRIAETLRQVGGLLEPIVGGKPRVDATALALRFRRAGGTSEGAAGEKAGILAARADAANDDSLLLRIQLLGNSEKVCVALSELVGPLARLGERVRLTPPPEGEPPGSVWVLTRIQGEPMGVARAAALTDQLRSLDELARDLQAKLPRRATDLDLEKAYAPVADFLDPIAGLVDAEMERCPVLADWAIDTIDLLFAARSIAVPTETTIIEQLSIESLAWAAQRRGGSLGRLTAPRVDVGGLLASCRKAPGIVAVPAAALMAGTSPYELGQQAGAMLPMLLRGAHEVMFSGRYSELQGIFSGGQGGAADPLAPVVVHVPERLDEDVVARFAVRKAAEREGGLAPAALDGAAEDLRSVLELKPPPTRLRLMPAVAGRVVRSAPAGAERQREQRRREIGRFVAALEERAETFAGIGARPRARRSARVKAGYVEVLTSKALLGRLRGQLVGQDAALTRLTGRLHAEVLTRPDHQPIRYCAQGTPGIGKSESAAMLARELGIPLIHVDAASMPDHYTASAQLLGSGRGIVGSFQAGRLEQAAKHHDGALVEIADLDHAAPSVRGLIGDLFLNILETGEAQSAAGATFGCANLIFAFTLNLPEGKDEKAHGSIGFGDSPGHEELSRRVTAELKKLFSGALLSRLGAPVIFYPLGSEALVEIARRSLATALWQGTRTLGISFPDLEIGEAASRFVVESPAAPAASAGARGVADRARALAAAALLALTPAELESLASATSIHVVARGPAQPLGLRPDPEEVSHVP